MSDTHNNNSKSNGSWWKTALVTVGAVLAGALASFTGIKGQLDSNTQDIFRLQLELRNHEQHLDRIETKVDRLIERKP